MVETVPAIQVEGLVKMYPQDDRDIRAVDGVDLFLEPGVFTALVGPSGCGKTTLLRLIAGLETPSSGRITRTPSQAFPATVFQDPRLLPWMTVKKNLLLALRRAPGAPGTKKEKMERIERSLDRVGLSSWLQAYPPQLSGGMAQRASLARALCRESGFLLMDEPFSALDALTREKLQKDLKGICREEKRTVLFITHDIREAEYLADRVLIMTGGRIAGDLRPSEQADMPGAIYEIMGGEQGQRGAGSVQPPAMAEGRPF